MQTMFFKTFLEYAQWTILPKLFGALWKIPLVLKGAVIQTLCALELNALAIPVFVLFCTYQHLNRKNNVIYSKTCLKRALKKKTKIVFEDRLSLNAGQRIAQCSNGSILQYFRPSLSYHLSFRYLFCLFLSDRLRQVLEYL